MKTITLDNVPDEVYGVLEAKAKKRNRQLSEEALEALRATLSFFSYKELVEDAPIGVFRTTAGENAHFVFANEALARILGYESKDKLVHTVKDIANEILKEPEKRKEFERILREKKEVIDFEYRIKKNVPNTFIIAALTARLVTSDDGVFYEGFLQDVTEKKKTEATLKATKDQLESVLRNIRGFVYTCTLREILTVMPPNRAGG